VTSSDPTHDPRAAFSWSIAQRPCAGEQVSGDAGIAWVSDRHLLMAVVDGLGHGEPAHEVAQVAQSWLTQHGSPDLEVTMRGLHEALRGTRGAAATLACLDAETHRGASLGVGNVALQILRAAGGRFPSADGILGQSMRTPRLNRFELGQDDVLLIYSDGVNTEFGLEDYPQARYLGAEAVARTVIRRYAQLLDDATCLAVRRPR
jgi:hypothetical protein